MISRRVFRILRPTLVIAVTALVTPFASACGSSTEPEGDVTPQSISITASPNPVAMPNSVQLTAEVLPAGAVQNVTWSSEDPDAATVDGSGTVTPLRRGAVRITATSTADASVTGSIEITIECPDPRLVSERVTADTEWEDWIPDPECFDYVVQVDIDIDGEVLTVQPGTVAGFEEGLRLRVVGDAGLVAEGTEEKPIVLSGTTSERGFWEGVGITGREFEHVITWVTIEHTKGEAQLGGSLPDAALQVTSDVTVRMENNTFRESSGYGLYLAGDVDVPGTGGNTMTVNALGPANVPASEVEDVLAGNAVTTGNDIDEVVVRPNTIRNDAVWTSDTMRVQDRSGQQFNVTGSLTLGPGVEIRMEGEESLLVLDGGGLSAIGTGDDPVIITGTEAVPGHWGGVRFVGTANPLNRLEHVVVEYGGRGTSANVTVERGGTVDSQVTITNTVSRHSLTYGLYARHGSVLEDFFGNVLTANTLGPLSIDAPVVRYLMPGNSFTGNAVDEITVHAGTARHLLELATWHDHGIPYFMKQFNSREWDVVGVTLTLDPGVEMLFGPELRMVIHSGGVLVAEGTEDAEIVLEPKESSWSGLVFVDATGRFDYATIASGGNNAEEANVEISSAQASSTVHFTGNVSMSGATYNIYFNSGPTTAVGCIPPIRIPPLDEVSDHCRPPGG